MGKFIDITGQKFGKLTVVGRCDFNGSHGTPYWNCLCDCGISKIIRKGDLVRRKQKSCGCSKKSNIDRIRRSTCTKNKKDPLRTEALEYYGANTSKFRRRISSVYAGAKARGLLITLTAMEVAELLVRHCFYCAGRKVTGIDRIDNTRGYIPGNVVPACKTCNYGKHTQTQEQFKNWIKRTYENWVIR